MLLRCRPATLASRATPSRELGRGSRVRRPARSRRRDRQGVVRQPAAGHVQRDGLRDARLRRWIRSGRSLDARRRHVRPGPPQADSSPDARFTLTAHEATIRLASRAASRRAHVRRSLTRARLRVTQGDLVEVTLANEDVDVGVTIHWHGVDVPGARRTGSPVSPRTRCYPARATSTASARSRSERSAHTHQVSSKEVRRPLRRARHRAEGEPTSDVDETVVAHTFDGIPTLNGSDRVEELAIEPGATVRLRLLNSDSTPHRLGLLGTPFVVAAIDGTVLQQAVAGQGRDQIAGGRVDLSAFTMPRTPARLAWLDTEVGVALNGGLGRVFEPPDKEFDHAHVRQAGAGAVRRVEAPSTGSSTSRSRGSPEFPRRRPEAPVGDQRRHPAGRPGLRRRAGRPRRDHPSRTTRRASTRCTCTGITCSCWSWARSPVSREPVVVRHARRPPRRALRGRLPRRQPGPLDGPLPQPPARRGRSLTMRRVRGRDDAVPRGRRSPQHARIAVGATSRRPARRRSSRRCPRPTRSSSRAPG